MKIETVIVFFAGICIINEASATFNLCRNNDGVDVCNTEYNQGGGGRGFTAPRPHRISPPRPIAIPRIKTICRHEIETVSTPKPLVPIGDVCNCAKQIVKPAPLPTFPKASCLPSFPKINFDLHKCSCASCNNDSPTEPEPEPECGHPVRAPEEYQISNNKEGSQRCNHKDATIYLDPHKRKTTSSSKHSYGKADVVSLSIARQLANQARNSVSEKHLQYGSLKEPVIPEKIEKKNENIHINEESFFDTKGEVLEIKSNLFHRKPLSSESESCEEQKTQPIQEFHPAHLKYDEIGYAAYHPSSNPRYVVVKNSQPEKKDSHPHTTRRPKQLFNFKTTEKPCDCYKNLVADRSDLSDSLSFENLSGLNLFTKGRMST